ncbi:MAG TPA: hypothetical protein PKE12_02395 [Kiritimatiellia bacterium]|nr:hypothetical protein [Kiritimatiellia bacterium]
MIDAGRYLIFRIALFVCAFVPLGAGSARALVHSASVGDAAGGWMEGATYQSVSAVGQGQSLGRAVSDAHTNITGFLAHFHWPSSSQDFAPILEAIGHRTVLVDQWLDFTVYASDPNGTLPGLVAEPLPPGVLFETGQSGSSRTGQFSWTPTEEHVGVHPVRFSAFDAQFTNDELVLIYVGAAGDGTNNAGGMPDSLLNYNPLTNLIAVSSGNATVQWAAAPGIPYKIYYSDHAVSSNMTWSLLATVVATGSVGSVVDAGFGGSPGRTYTIGFGDYEPLAGGAWRGNKSALTAQRFTLVGPAVTSDRNFGGAMGSNLAVNLTGDASALGDRIHILQPNGTWRILWLDENRRWREAADNGFSSYTLPVGRGFILERPSLAPATLMLAGRVGNEATNSLAMAPGWNLISLSEGKALPIQSTFADGGPIGGASLSTADQLHLLNSNGSWTTLMHIQGWGAPWDGNWLNLNTFQIYTNRLMPGQAYYYYRQAGSMDVNF